MRAAHCSPFVALGLLTVALACSTDPGSAVSSGGSSSGGSGAANSTGGAAGTGGTTGGGGGVSAGSTCGTDPLPKSPLALLTRSQYDNTVFDLLGDDTKPSAAFPPENQVQGFKNNTTAHQASPLAVEKYLEAAEGLATRAVANRLSSIAPCSGSDLTACGAAFVRNFGLRAFRRPLTDAETAPFDALFNRAAPQMGYASAIGLTLQAILQSPQFLYRIDTRVAPSERSGAVALGPYEIASRLAYFLTGSMPDDPLFAAAAANQLSSEAEIEMQARRLVETPRARAVVREFHHQWLGLDALPSLARDLPEDEGQASLLGQDWLESLDRFVDHVYWEDGNVAELFASKRVYVNDRMARLYEVSAPSSGFSGVDIVDRAGLVTQPGLMALLAHSNQSAPVLRGVFVLERLMCVPVPPPPPTVNNTPPDPDPKATTRERFRVHTASEDCAGCHRIIDGVGFGFEAYDQLGRYRAAENGIPVDTSGEILAGDTALMGPFNGVTELGARLMQSPRVRDCVATHWYRFALGRQETSEDSCSLNQVKADFAAASGDLRELLVAITRSVAFRYRPATAPGGS